MTDLRVESKSEKGEALAGFPDNQQIGGFAIG